MNGALIVTFLRQRLTTPIRLAFLIIAGFFPLLFIAAAPAMGLAPLGDSFQFSLVFGAGMIGQDVSSGVLQLLFARPVRRDVYVISRWFAASLAAAVVAVVQIGLAALILSARGATPEAGAVAIAWANHIASAFGATAPLLLLSALVAGLGDIGVLFLIYACASILQTVGAGLGHALISRIGQELQNFINPTIDFALIVNAFPSWYQLIAYLSTVTLSIALAIVIVNRKELSYASSS